MAPPYELLRRPASTPATGLAALLRGGLSKDERAEHLGVVPATVKWHLHSLYFKRLLDEALADAHRLAGLER